MHATKAYLRSFKTLSIDVDQFKRFRRQLPRHLVVDEVTFVRERLFGNDIVLRDYEIWYRDGTFDRRSLTDEPPQVGEHFPRLPFERHPFNEWTDASDPPEPMFERMKPVKTDLRTEDEKDADEMYPNAQRLTLPVQKKLLHRICDQTNEFGMQEVKVRRKLRVFPFEMTHKLDAFPCGTAEEQRLWYISRREDPVFERWLIHDPNTVVPDLPTPHELTLRPLTAREGRNVKPNRHFSRAAKHVNNLDDVPELGVDIPDTGQERFSIY